MNENKKKKKKKEANQWRCKYYNATAETQQYSQLLQPDKHFIQLITELIHLIHLIHLIQFISFNSSLLFCSSC